MKQRVSFGAKEKRRDQRRAISIEGSIDGVRVDLIDLSVTGLGGRTIALRNSASLYIHEGRYATLEFTSPDGQQVALSVKIQRIDHAAGEFGATFLNLSDRDFDAVEKLMFPRRGNAKAQPA